MEITKADLFLASQLFAAVLSFNLYIFDRYIFETNTIGFENEAVNVDDVIRKLLTHYDVITSKTFEDIVAFFVALANGATKKVS